MRSKKVGILDGVRSVISKYGDLFLFCGVDDAGNLHLLDIGKETKVMREMLAHKEILGGSILYYFEKKNLERNKTYIFKFSIENGVLRTESFGGMPIIPTMRKVG